jgi:hypothetical protein
MLVARWASLWLAVILLVGCHHIKSDYPGYVAQHPGSPALGHVNAEADWELGNETWAHRTVIRSGLAGFGNKWVVELGEMLAAQLASSETRAAFSELTPRDHRARAYTLRFALLDYRVSGFAAHVKLRVTVQRGAEWVLDKTYEGEGQPQAGKVAWGGAFAMRRALQATTKQAIDAVLRELLVDLERAAEPAATEHPAATAARG